MTPTLRQPDHELLQKLLLGQLPSVEAERLAAEYAEDSRLAVLAESLAGQDDTLLKRLKDQETAVDTDAERRVARLVQRLKTALPPAHDTAVSNPTDATLPPSGPTAPGTQTLPLQLEYYKPLKVLGQGGMGTVYLALDTRLGREVAIKTLRPELAANPQAKERFLREARTAAKLGHDHIIPIYYVGEADGTPFLAMPLLKGEPLDALLKRSNGPLPLAQAVRIAREAASGLAAAHEAGPIHRDIKPANIWLEAPSGRVKVLDFGLAKSAAASETTGDTDLTAYGAIVGTPAYMAPEQAGGKPVNGRADLFSLGCVLYEMLAGKRPFAGPDTMSILMSLASHTPPAPHTLKPQCPASLSRLVMQLLEKDPAARPASAHAVMEALDNVELAPPIVDAKPGRIERPAKPQAAGKTWKTACGLAVSLLALLPLGYLFGAQIIRIVTNQGQIVIETDGAGIEVVIKDGEGKVLDKETKREITFKAGEYNLEVTVTDANGEQRFVTDHFELKRNGRKIVDARWIVAKVKPSAESSDADRRAAEWVLSMEGSSIGINGTANRFGGNVSLPQGEFQLTAVGMAWNAKVTDAGVAHFKNCKSLTELYLSHNSVTGEGLSYFRDCKNLKHLTLEDIKATDVGLAHFKDCTELKRIRLTNTQVTNAGLAHFKNCKDLTELTLAGLQVTDAGLACFENCKNLTELCLISVPLGDSGLSHFKDCKNLIHVNLDATQTTGAGLAYFKDCKNLKILLLDRTSLDDPGLESLAAYPSLSTLLVTRTKVTEDGVKKLAAALPACRIEWDGGVIEPAASPDRRAAEYVLSIGGGVVIHENGGQRGVLAVADLPRKGVELTCVYLSGNSEVTDAEFVNFKECKNLTYLGLDNTQVSDAGLAHFKDCKNLTFLELSSTKVSDAGLAHFRDCKNLAHLGLGGTLVSDTGLAYFKDCKNLTNLGLGCTLVSDTGLAHFKDCKNLTNLGLYSTQVSDAGLAHFKDCKNLTYLGLDNTQVNDAGLAHFKDCKNLTYLGLDNTQVNDAGLELLGKHPILGSVKVTKSKVTEAGVKKLSATLPECKIEWDGGVIEPTVSPDRRAAEWVLAAGGVIHIKVDGRQPQLKPGEPLPAGQFELIDVNMPFVEGVSDASLAVFKGCRHVKSLNLNGDAVSDVGIANFKDCQLEALMVSDTQITDAGLVHFRDCKKLWDLHLGSPGITDAGLSQFKDCQKLEHLSLRTSKVTDESLSVLLPGWQIIKQIDLTATVLSDATLERLAGCSQLASVNVTNTKVSEAGVKKLSAALPKCKIEWDGGVIEPGNSTNPDRKAALVRGNWRIVGDVIENLDKEKQALLLFGRSDFADGDFTCEVLRSEGDHGLALVARATDLENYYYFDIGVFKNAYHSLYAKEAGSNWRRIDQQKAEPVPTDRWVKLRLRLRGESWECYLDDKLVVSGKDDRRLKGYLGLRTWNEAGKYRNLKFTDPTGNVLWAGLPELPPAAVPSDPDRRAAE